VWVKEPHRPGSRFSAWRWKGAFPETVFHLARPHVVRELVRTGRFDTWKGFGRGLTMALSHGAWFTTHPYLLAANLAGPMLGLRTWGYVEVRTDAIPAVRPCEYSWRSLTAPLAFFGWHPAVLPPVWRIEAGFWTPRSRFDVGPSAIVSHRETIDVSHPLVTRVRAIQRESLRWRRLGSPMWSTREVRSVIERALAAPGGVGP
jgi:hypothetical protein